MVTYFNKSDLVSFGNYLLSEERTNSVVNHPEMPMEILTQRLSSVSHADLENWVREQK